MAARPLRLLVPLALALAPAAHGDVVEYLHTDLLGSVVAVTDQAGQVIERREYEPYGLPRTPIPDGPGYTGHDMDGNTGLIYAQQRYFDPEVGRFLSIDPVGVSAATGANFNRYWYANDNPYRFVDPDGRCAGSRLADRQGVCDFGGGHAAGAGGVMFDRRSDIPVDHESDPSNQGQPSAPPVAEIESLLSDLDKRLKEATKTWGTAADLRALLLKTVLEISNTDHPDEPGAFASTELPNGLTIYPAFFYMTPDPAGLNPEDTATLSDLSIKGQRQFMLIHELVHRSGRAYVVPAEEMSLPWPRRPTEHRTNAQAMLWVRRLGIE